MSIDRIWRDSQAKPEDPALIFMAGGQKFRLKRSQNAKFYYLLEASLTPRA